MMNFFGDRWSWLLLREAFYGATRFSAFQRSTGASRNILTDKLNALVENDIFGGIEVGVRGKRTAYGLTEKGRDLLPVMIAMGKLANTHEYGVGKEPVLQFSTETRRTLKSMQFFDVDETEILLKNFIHSPALVRAPLPLAAWRGLRLIQTIFQVKRGSPQKLKGVLLRPKMSYSRGIFTGIGPEKKPK